MHRKILFEKWFLAILILVAVISFFAIDLVISKVVENRYKVNPIDEKTVYKGSTYDIKNDSDLLPAIKPIK